MWMKFLSARACNTIKPLIVEIIVSRMYGNNSFFVFIINTISITMSCKKTKLVFMHDTDNILFI